MNLTDLMKKGSLGRFATATVATFATDGLDSPPSVSTVAAVNVATTPKQAANNPAPDPDQWCWPHTQAMNTAEIDTFTGRLATFTDRGLTMADAEALADRLVVRDREKDDRRVCLECPHLRGADRWRCGNGLVAGVTMHLTNAQLPRDWVSLLQRCEGFGQLAEP